MDKSLEHEYKDTIEALIGLTKVMMESVRDIKCKWPAPTKDTTSYVRVKDSLASGAGGR